jgi:hypothetical protein
MLACLQKEQRGFERVLLSEETLSAGPFGMAISVPLEMDLKIFEFSND